MRKKLSAFLDHSGLLVAGTLLALAWANVDRESYEAFAHPLHFAVNDIGMAFFFALAAKEVVEATAPGGALHSPRRSAVPLVAAIGGMVGPAAIYATLVLTFGRPELMRGWAIPVATDIAFSYLVARVIFGVRHPGIPFLLLLAIVDDALGLLILAVFYPTSELRLVEFAIILTLALTLACWLRSRRHAELLAVCHWCRRRLVARLLLGWPAPGARARADHSVRTPRCARRGSIC